MVNVRMKHFIRENWFRILLLIGLFWVALSLHRIAFGDKPLSPAEAILEKYDVR